ncbi:MAG: ATPase [Candidatus Moranbacteria bacterium CG_4_9_14_3_um_filter_42_9]|nr:MAG: ATPase [Candidatus Moranbacteria bacterium CG_4_9_14_3_um_filter_42_9]
MKKELIIKRVFNAPVERVWRAWTDPEEAKKWWGPKGFTAPVVEIDFRVGGKYLYCMRGAATSGGKEQDFWSTGVYQEITPLEKIIVIDSFSDEKGNVVPATHYGMSADFPREMKVVEIFEAQGDMTKFTLRHKGFPANDIEGARAGWNSSLDKLAESLEGQKERAGVTFESFTSEEK